MSAAEATTTTRRKKVSADAVKRSPEDDHRRTYLFGLYRRSHLTFLREASQPYDTIVLELSHLETNGRFIIGLNALYYAHHVLHSVTVNDLVVGVPSWAW